MPPLTDLLTHVVVGVAAWCHAHPTPVVAIAVAAATVLQGGRLLLAGRQQHRRHRGARLLTISPPPQADPAGTDVFWATAAAALRTRGWRRIWPGRGHLAVEYRWVERTLTIAVWVPGTVPAGPIRAAIHGAWPGAVVAETEPAPPLPLDATTAAGGVLAPVLPAWYPLRTEHNDDPLRTLIAAAAGLRPGDSACVQILARPATLAQLRRLRSGATALRTGTPAGDVLDPLHWLHAAADLLQPATQRTRPTGRDAQRDRDARAAADKVSGPQWQVTVRYGAAHTDPRGGEPAAQRPRIQAVAHDLAVAFGVYTGRNQLRHRPSRHAIALLAGRSPGPGWLLGAAELAALSGLPRDLAVPGLDRAQARPMPAPPMIATGGRGTKALGTAAVGGRPVALAVADARQHLHVLGSTGSGKSTLLVNLALADINAGRGTIVIDPRGDLVIDLLERIPARHADRLVLIDPDQPAGTTLNPLSGDDHDLTVDNIVSIFSRIFAKHWGPRIDDTLRVACLTLLRRPNATLALIPQLLNDRRFRQPYTTELDDPEGLRGFWEWFESTPPPLRAQITGPVLARLRAFLLRDFVRRTFGSPHSSVDMRAVLDGGILLARLPKGQLGEETTRLMGSFILASAWQAATGRIRVAEQRRRDAVVYIDEAHNFLNLPGSVADMLAEARGYHFGLVLAHQNLAQMPRETQQALSANARNKIFFSCAPEDAQQLARHTLPELTDYDVSHLGAYTAACRLIVAGRETPAFTLHTNPPAPTLGKPGPLRRAAAAAMAARVRRFAADADEPPQGGPGPALGAAPDPAPQGPAGPPPGRPSPGGHAGGSHRA
ncbi:type IV secretory system conjugative DNA transfer family protein [Dactylosporangium sp. NPDC051541]|uniref:type IV secretory system conjugative DNA transfer family protein n=1 Tax=Dactylosporangium sp. NPDC051541 TaxID=3363977 RepID=UPI0037A02218